jgi:serine-type D-Ala-D-Ala carboxypeptidase/endopeptidase (penicillin-binding protein 4)
MSPNLQIRSGSPQRPSTGRFRPGAAVSSFLRVAFLLGALGLPAGLAIADPTAGVSPIEELLSPMAKDRLFSVAKVGVQIVNVRTGEEVFARNADTALIPASTMKIVTAAAALKRLGSGYRFTTDIAVDGELDASGKLQGNLYVRGHGDPTLVLEKLWKLVYDLKLYGIEQVQGDIVFDESFFGTNYDLVGWDKAADLREGPAYFPSLGALSLNTNAAGLVIRPGTALGAPARLALETPASDYITLDNQLKTGSASSRYWFDIEREVEDDGKMKFTVTGSVPIDQEVEREYRSVEDPTAHFIAAFREQVRAQGITVSGRYRRGTVPGDAEIIQQLRSPPLAQILADMDKYSYNFHAEQVLRALGAEVLGAPGTVEKGVAVVQGYLSEIGLEPTDYHLVNGSGLSRGTAMRPSAMTAVLMDMAHDDKVGPEFEASLAIAGVDGTLARRIREDPARMRGKTGTLDGVHCLAGYLDASDGERYAFAFFANGDRATSATVKALQDRMARALLASAPGQATADGSPDED